MFPIQKKQAMIRVFAKVCYAIRMLCYGDIFSESKIKKHAA